MKSPEFIKMIQEADPDGQLEIVVPTMLGIGCAAVSVTNVSRGFDWCHGKLIIGIDHPLVRFDAYKIMEDERNNAGHVCRVKLQDDSFPMRYVVSRKLPLKVDQIVKVRRVGHTDDELIKVKVTAVAPEHENLDCPGYSMEVIKE